MLSVCSFAQNAPKLSPLTQIFFQQQQRGFLPENYVYKKDAQGNIFISALAQMKPNASSEWLEQVGVKIGTKAGSVWTLHIPIEQLQQVVHHAQIDYFQLDEPIHPTLDSARWLTRVDSVHGGLGNLPQAFKGKDVVVGIIDAGFDYRHPSLFDSSGNLYRVKRIWEQVNVGNPPSSFNYGNEITVAQDMWNKGYDMIMSHGAHVAGIASGGGYGTNISGASKGMAPEANLVLVGITPAPYNWTSTGMTSIIDGMNYIFSYANSIGKPAVANLSWGCSIGPHDGLSLFSKACDALTGPGKIFVCSAGNNGSNKLHVNKTFSSTDTLVQSFVGFSSYLSEKRTWVDIWGDSSKTFCLQLSLYNGATKVTNTSWICLDNQLHNAFLIGQNGDTLWANITTSTFEFNGKPRIFIELFSKVTETVLVSVKGNSGNVHMWSGFVKNTTGYYADFTNNGFNWAVNGNINSTVGDMACTKSALAVGAYVSKNKFTNFNGSFMDYSGGYVKGAITSFSSRGPSSDGRVKPDIAAPGLMIGSAVNSYDTVFNTGGNSFSSVVDSWLDPNNNKTYNYAMLAGTSMSSPAAAGIVALLLQVNPTLTPKQVNDILAQTAIKDAYTTNLPAAGNNIWGHGKINAMSAVLRTIQLLSIGTDEHTQNNIIVYPNPATAQCFIILPKNANVSAELMIKDEIGRLVYVKKLNANDGEFHVLDLANWSKGIYFVELKQQEKYYTQKLIVE